MNRFIGATIMVKGAKDYKNNLEHFKGSISIAHPTETYNKLWEYDPPVNYGY